MWKHRKAPQVDGGGLKNAKKALNWVNYGDGGGDLEDAQGRTYAIVYDLEEDGKVEFFIDFDAVPATCLKGFKTKEAAMRHAEKLVAKWLKSLLKCVEHK